MIDKFIKEKKYQERLFDAMWYCALKPLLEEIKNKERKGGDNNDQKRITGKNERP